MHGPNRTLAAVPTRRGSRYNYSRYSALVPQLSPSSSPFNTRTPACHETHTPHHYIHPGRRGCMFTHAHRHLPHIQRPHTRCFPYIRPLTHTRLFAHAYRSPHTHPTTHTRGGTHTWCFTHTDRLFTRTWGAGKHAPRHTRNHTTHTRGFFHTRCAFQHARCTHTFHHTHRDNHTGESGHL